IALATLSTTYSLYLLIGGSFRVCGLAALLDPGERGHDRPLRHLVGQVLLHDPLCGLHLLQFLRNLLHQILCGHGCISLITNRVNPCGLTCLRVFNFSCVTIRRCTWASAWMIPASTSPSISGLQALRVPSRSGVTRL